MTSLDRLGMLDAQCRGYVGPLSAAVYIPLVLEDDPNLGSDFIATGGADAKVGESGAGRRRLQEAGGGGQQQELRGGRRSLRQAVPQDPVAAARAQLQDFFDRMEQNSSSCQLRLMLFAERLKDRPLAAIMPTNAMRNAAMLGATTPLTAMFDVDLGFSVSINGLVRNSAWTQFVAGEANSTQPALCIPPAWEVTGHLIEDVQGVVVQAALTGEKQVLVALWQSSLVQYFAEDICVHCHGPFEHKKWASTSSPYPVEYGQGFEPWGILWRRGDPGYDERFRGWMYDKQTHVEALARKHRFRMVVLPDMWLVHRPHKKAPVAQIFYLNKKLKLNGVDQHNSTASLLLSSASKETQALLQVVKLDNGTLTNMYRLYRAHVDTLRNNVRAALINNQPYEPQLNAQFLHCKSVLPWWRP